MRTSHLARYRDIATLLVKHRHAIGSTDDDDAGAGDAQALAGELERMGPTFVKLGQLLSTRADLLPPSYLRALSRLQERVEPFPYEDVERIVRVELGVRISKAFASFDEKPLAAASLGQVHRAELRDGRAVAVKVQRPNVREQILDDLDAIEELATLADAHTENGRRLGFADMVGEFRRSLLDELDYRKEAANLDTMRANLADQPLIVVPAPIHDYTTAVVLTMDFISGTTVAGTRPVGMTEVDGPRLARALFDAYLDQFLVHGFFHADPHPGNVVLTDDGRLALIDLGMTAQVEPALQEQLVKLLLAIGDGRGSDAAEVAIAIGRPLPDFDPDAYRRAAAELVSRHSVATMANVQAGAIVAELTQTAGECGLRLPAELTMLGKALLNLDDIARRLDPSFDPNAALRDASADLVGRKVLQGASPANLMNAALEAKEFAEHLPRQLNQLFDALAQGRFTVNIEGIDERNIMRSAQKLANRVTAGLVVAALVVGAALIMRIPTHATLFGYPALAIVLFLVAAAAAIWLFVTVQVHDEPQHRRRGTRLR
ncbi:MAG TPA: AarF/UbiB family protein [Acidimicrobiales bacterium]|nr:AarF/UbiB family protein [Acidimicrobiales bacterium]